jgi:hypothetical protein
MQASRHWRATSDCFRRRAISRIDPFEPGRVRSVAARHRNGRFIERFALRRGLFAQHSGEWWQGRLRTMLGGRYARRFRTSAANQTSTGVSPK